MELKMNWPGAMTIAKRLVQLGDPVSKHLKEYVLGKDEHWVYWLLYFIVDE
ncbi:DUF5071 domain-containing protein [Brevibacillus ginsengisoli]|uniref:DUF5071 domain-containing protein n=1 Tax=Brevibacillus ginsengisoli TaxID=363854 RepID=UPI003CF14DED